MNIDINGQRKQSSVYQYSEKIIGDSTYSISVNTYPGWKTDWEYSSSLSGTVLDNVTVNIYICPIVYEVHLYGNKPQASSGNLENRSIAGWQWDELGFYKRKFIYDRIGELPEFLMYMGFQGGQAYAGKRMIIH